MSALTSLPPYALTAGVIVIAVLGYFLYLRPQRGILLLAALVPLHGLVQATTPSQAAASWKEALVGLTLICAVLRADWSRVRRADAPWMLPFAVLVGIGAVSAFTTLPPTTTFYPLKVTFFYGLTIPLILWLHPFSARDRDHLITIMMVMAFGTGMFGIYQEIVGPDQLVSMGFEWNREIRLSGSFLRAFSTYGSPFPFAFFEMLVLLVCGTVAASDPRRPRNLIFLLSTPLYLVFMTIPIVRGAFLGIAAGLFWIGIRRYPRMLAWVSVSGVAIAGIVIAVFPKILKVFTSSYSLGERSSGWSASVHTVLTHPFGIGLGATGAAADKIALARHELTIPYQPDNYYMKMLIEIGPFGLWAFVSMLVAGILVSRKLERSAYFTQDRALALGVTAALVAGAAASMVATYFEIFPLDVYTWILLSTIATMPVRRRRLRTAPGAGTPTVGLRPPNDAPDVPLAAAR